MSDICLKKILEPYQNKNYKHMNYLAYYEVIESSGFHISNDLDKLKSEWCFSMRIFEVPDTFTQEEFDTWEKPRFQKVKSTFKQIHSEGHLMHETE